MYFFFVKDSSGLLKVKKNRDLISQKSGGGGLSLPQPNPLHGP